MGSIITWRLKKPGRGVNPRPPKNWAVTKPIGTSWFPKMNRCGHRSQKFSFVFIPWTGHFFNDFCQTMCREVDDYLITTYGPPVAQAIAYHYADWNSAVGVGDAKFNQSIQDLKTFAYDRAQVYLYFTNLLYRDFIYFVYFINKQLCKSQFNCR